MNIVLIGFMCSGKSRVGFELSRKTGWPHFDTDEMISKDVGASVADIIRKRGESEFREVESKAVRLVASLDKSIISTGGGVPTNADNMEALAKNGTLVWLKISPENVLKRAGNLKSRPLIDPKDPIGSIRTKMAEREKYYSKAPYQVDVDQLAPPAIAEKIIEMVPGIKS